MSFELRHTGGERNVKYKVLGGSNEFGTFKEQKEGHVPGEAWTVVTGDKAEVVNWI